MKKLILSMMLLAVVGVTTAQNYSNKSFRDAKRAERTAAYEQKLRAALVSQNFSINVDQFQADVYGPNPISAPNNYLDVYPDYLAMNLPYRSYLAVIQTPQMLDITAPGYDYTLKELPNAYIVMIKLTNVINGASNNPMESTEYSIHITISKTSGSATITITPNMSNANTYQGTVMIN